MSIYRDNLSAIVDGDNLLPIIVIAQNSFDLSITDIAFAIGYILFSPINYGDKQFVMHTALVFKVSKLALWKKYTVSINKVLIQFKKSLFVLFIVTVESVNCFLILKNLEKHFCNFTSQKNFVKHRKFTATFIGDNLSITDNALRN